MSENEAQLREANQLMQSMLEAIASPAPARPTKIGASQISQLRKILHAVGKENLTNKNGENFPAQSLQIKTYRENLQKLQKAIPTAQLGLQIRLAALERTRLHKESVADWFRANQEIQS